MLFGTVLEFSARYWIGSKALQYFKLIEYQIKNFSDSQGGATLVYKIVI